MFSFPIVLILSGGITIFLTLSSCIRVFLLSHTQSLLYHDTHFSGSFHFPSIAQVGFSFSQAKTASHPVPPFPTSPMTMVTPHYLCLPGTQVRVNLLLGSSLTALCLPSKAPCRNPQMAPQKVLHL